METQEINESREIFESQDLNNLYEALAKAQSEMEIAKKDSTNPFFKSKYSDLSQIVSASIPSLTKYGLSIIQRIRTNSPNQMFLYTRLCHASGQWIEAKMPINPPKNDIQSIGSYITYLRRYNLAAIVGVTVGEEDDDGEAAMPRNQKKEEAEKPKPEEKPIEKITPTQIREIDKLLFDLQDSDEKAVLKFCNVKAINEITQDKYETVINNLTARNKKLKEGKNANS
jgi:hypothetical protein